VNRRQLLAVIALAPLAVRAATDAPAAPVAAAPVDVARLPAPGTYQLPRVMRAPNGNVIAIDGRPARLHDLLRGRLSVVSFMYTYCRDPQGCPRAWAVMDALQVALRANPGLAARAQLVSVSFDPIHDTPQEMRFFAGSRARESAVRWHFLTTASVSALLPLLRGFGQDVTVETDAAGRPTRTLNHLLKVFLVDAQCEVREIYSVATLDPQALVNDLRTLQMEPISTSP
jgi:cytochrome oxidase Cu insertion factor (SCO1/SenC/PrrC family)